MTTQDLKDKAYDEIDGYLRDNLDDTLYAEFSGYLEAVYKVSQPNEPVYWIAECQPHMVELLNWDERTVFITDKTQLNDYIGTDDEPAGYDITPLYTSPPNTSELEQANKVLEAKCKELENEVDTSNFACDLLSKVLAEICLTVKGEPPYNTLFSYHDLPELVADLTAKLDKMQKALNTADVMLTLLREGDKGKQMDYVASRHNSMVAVSGQHKIVKQALEGV